MEKFRRDTAVHPADPISFFRPPFPSLSPRGRENVQDMHAHLFPSSCTATMNDCAHRGIYFSVRRDFSGAAKYLLPARAAESAPSAERKEKRDVRTDIFRRGPNKRIDARSSINPLVTSSEMEKKV